MQDIDNGTQAFDRLFADYFFVSFAEDHGAGMFPDQADDCFDFLKGIDGGQFCLHKDSEFIACFIEGFGGAPCMTADEVESGIFQDSEVMEILLFIEMRIAGFCEITVFSCSAEIGGISIDKDGCIPAYNGSCTPFSRNGIKLFFIL